MSTIGIEIVQCAIYGSTSECSGALSANHTDDDFTATELVVRCKDVLAQWSLDNPQESLLDFGTVVESQHLRRINPNWERSGLMLVGYRQKGSQIRLAWFKHARVKY